MFKSVNLGNDIDTIVAIAVGIAGVYYGFENIPEKWLKVLPKYEEIFKLIKERVKRKGKSKKGQVNNPL